ncbi:MAG: NADH:ubiquinone reductase (Na(+)-transporting) subunit F [Alphaproteobacteria bacterium]
MIDIVFGSLLFTTIVLALALTVLGVRAMLLPVHDIRVTINGVRDIRARAGGKLLGILHENGISLPSACAGAGTCGLCRVAVTAGGGEPLLTEIGKLKRGELRAGIRMACQVVARDDMALTVPEELFGVKTFACTVLANQTVAPFIKELVLSLPVGSDFEFEPGAFVQLTAPPFRLLFSDIEVREAHREAWDRHDLWATTVASNKPVTRAYSIANTPSETGRIVLNIRLALQPPGAGREAAPGIVSSYLFALKPGAVIDTAGPYGGFRAQDTDREMVFIGGGVGMAPLRAIIFDQLERRRSKRKITFWYGARSVIELFYRDGFDDLQARHDNFDWTVALSDPKPRDDWQGTTGFIHNVALERYLDGHPAPEDCEYYLCGPPLMIRAALAMLDDLGVEADCIFNDDFGSEP